MHISSNRSLRSGKSEPKSFPSFFTGSKPFQLLHLFPALPKGKVNLQLVLLLIDISYLRIAIQIKIISGLYPFSYLFCQEKEATLIAKDTQDLLNLENPNYTRATFCLSC